MDQRPRVFLINQQPQEPIVEPLESSKKWMLFF